MTADSINERIDSVERFLDKMSDVVTRSCLTMSVEGKGVFDIRRERLQFFIEIKSGFRPSIVSDGDLVKLWQDRIRNNETITDFVLTLLSEMCVYGAETDVIRSALIHSMVSLTSTDTEKLSFDKDLFDDALTVDEAKRLYDTYPWLKAMLLLRLLNYGEIALRCLEVTGGRSK